MSKSTDEVIKYLLSHQRDLIPSSDGLQKLVEEYKKILRYAFHKLKALEERYFNHLSEFHPEGTCDEVCHKKHLSDFNLNEYKHYAKTLYEYVRAHAENTSDA